ncbi:hypothetical protein COP1_026282 [Malus domestica]
MIEDHGLGSDLHLVSALSNMYSKCGAIDIARGLFDGLLQRDVISRNVMICGYTHKSHYKRGPDALLVDAIQSNTEPNDVTFLGILPACDHLGALDLDKWIHAYIDKNFQSFTNTSLWTSLIGMYAKYRNIEAAKQVFNGMEAKPWLLKMGMQPLIFSRKWRMKDLNQMLPHLWEFYLLATMVGDPGYLMKVFMKSMEMKLDNAVWGSLLGACRLYRRVELREYVAKHLFELEPENARSYVLLSNIYAGAGRWDDMARIRTSRLNDMGIKKVPGSTSIQVDNVVHEFLVSDKSHPLSKEIYKMLEEINRRLYTAGFVPDTSEVLYDIDEEWKEVAFSHHSEKLAIAFSLISTKAGTTIRIVKNLCVSGNCHSARKLISKIFNREIIARDGNRFDHFRDASCPCNVNWW